MALKKLDQKEFDGIPRDSYSYDINYKLYWDDSGDLLPPGENVKNLKIYNRAACFAGGREIMASGKYNRLIFTLTNKMVDDTTRICWVEAAKKEKVLPSYITRENSNNYKDFVIKLDEEDLPLSLMYVYLSTLRDMQEHKAVVVITVKLMNKGMLYIPALILASKLMGNYGGHAFLGLAANYGAKVDINKLEIPVHYMLGFKRYLRDPIKYDPHPMYKNGKFTGVGGRFNGESSIRTAVDEIKQHFIKPAQLFTKTIEKALAMQNTESAVAAISKLKKI